MAVRECLTVRTNSQAETEAFGEAVGTRIDAGTCIVLSGQLGCGKTALIRGICHGLGADDAVVSPTFILHEPLAGRLPIAHLDLYRLAHEEEMAALGVFDLIGGDTVMLVEWGDRSPALMAAADAVIRIGYAGATERDIVVHARPDRHRWFQLNSHDRES